MLVAIVNRRKLFGSSI